jgi:hypothetical protein
MKPKSKWARRLLLLLLAASTLPSVGCLAAGLVAAGAAVAGASTYAVVQGRLVRDYPAGYQETLQATQASLADLGFPILKREGADTNVTLVTETSNGTKVSIDLTPQTSPIPGDGVLTRVGVRVGTLGDEEVSARILDAITVHLVPAARNMRPGLAPGAIQPVAAQGPLPPPPVPQVNTIPVRETTDFSAPIRSQTAPPIWRSTSP